MRLYYTLMVLHVHVELPQLFRETVDFFPRFGQSEETKGRVFTPANSNVPLTVPLKPGYLLPLHTGDFLIIFFHLRRGRECKVGV